MIKWTCDRNKNIKLDFDVCSKGEAEQIDEGGVYIFVNSKEISKAIYVGRVESFSDRLPNHERWGEAKKLGANRIAVAIVDTEDEREKLEALLIRDLQPPLNVQLK